MSTSHRICETCVYCSFAGNCDRYNKPLISIEQPACDTYEIHPLLAENAKLRELVRNLRECTRHNVCALCDYVDDACDFDYDMRELGIEVDA